MGGGGRAVGEVPWGGDLLRELLQEVTEKLEHAVGDRVVSGSLYESSATAERADKFSDLNVLCVLKEIRPRELLEAEPVLSWWREKEHPAPLLMSEEEVHNSADSFPIEFHDMKEHRRVLYGLDLIAELKIDHRKSRTRVEHERRAKLLRTSQQGASK